MGITRLTLPRGEGIGSKLDSLSYIQPYWLGLVRPRLINAPIVSVTSLSLTWDVHFGSRFITRLLCELGLFNGFQLMLCSMRMPFDIRDLLFLYVLSQSQ